MRTSLIMLSSMAVLLLAACSGSSGASVADVSDEYILAAEQAVEAAVVTIDDLPPGWTVDLDDDEGEDDDENDFLFTRECMTLNDFDSMPGQIAEAVSSDFDGRPGHSFSTDATAFVNEAAAKKAVNTFQSLRITCVGQIRQATLEGLRYAFASDGATDAELATLSVIVHDLPFPPLSDHADAYQIRWQANIGDQAYDVVLHFPYWRRDNIVASVTYMTFAGEPDLRLETLIAEIADEKLVEALATLAEAE